MVQLIIFSAINDLSLTLGSLTGIFLKLKQKTIAILTILGFITAFVMSRL